MADQAIDLFGPGRPSLQDRIDIQDVVASVPLFVDTGDYERLPPLFTADALMDYSSLFPGDDAKGVKEFLEQVEQFMPGFDATQHILSSFDIRVQHDAATSRCQVQANHWVGDRSWLLHGLYVHRLVRAERGWQISHQRYQLTHEAGDRGLIEEAAARVASNRLDRG